MTQQQLITECRAGGNTSGLVRCVLLLHTGHSARHSPRLTFDSALLVCRKTQPTHFSNQPFHHRGLDPRQCDAFCLCRCFFFCFSFFFPTTEPTRFSVVAPDLFARAPKKYFCRKLCVYLVCVTGAGEMAGIMGFIYVHTHLLCPVSGTLTRGTHSSPDTSLLPPRIERAFTSRGVSQRDSANWKSRSSTALWPGLRTGH